VLVPKHKVLIMRCDAYDPERIAGIVKEGMDELDARPSGRILLKPNVVIAHPESFPHAFTRKEFLDGVISAVKTRAQNAQQIAVGERSGIVIPTRYSFKQAGYLDVIKRHKVKAYYFDESRQVPVRLSKPGRLRDNVYVPQPITECDYLINLPKFKAHPWCRVTLSLKNFIGLQDDRHRLLDHNLFLEHKIADLQEVIEPKFIAIDGIIAGQRMMLTPTPFPLGAIVMGTNSCAVDTVGCHMVHIDPEDVVYLRLAAERGYGPMSLDEIEVAGDFPLEEVQERTRGFEICFERIDDYFRDDGNLTCTVGTFPEKHSPDYCWGGCPGALQEAMHIFKTFYPDFDKRMKKIRYVVGKVAGPLDLERDERVIFAGSCTSWEGRIGGDAVKIESSYKTASAVDERRTRSHDMLLKMSKALWNCARKRSSRYIRVTGCPVSVAEHLHYLSTLGKIKNPNLEPRLMSMVYIAYWRMRISRFLNRFLRITLR
jgi:uncharacterized protein (DUF362 family)